MGTRAPALRIVLSVATAAGLTGAGGFTAGATAPPPSPPTESTLAAPRPALTFTEGVYGAIDTAPYAALVVPNSPAWFYLAHQVALERAVLATGQPGTGTMLFLTETGPNQVNACIDDGSSTQSCTDFAYTTDVSGLITDLTVDGTSVDGRLGGPSEPVTAGPATWTVASSYLGVQAGTLVIVLDIATTADVELWGLSQAAYIAPDGVQLQATEALYTETLYARAKTTAAVVFAGAPPGGTLRFQVYDAESNPIDVAVPAPVASFAARSAATAAPGVTNATEVMESAAETTTG